MRSRFAVAVVRVLAEALHGERTKACIDLDQVTQGTAGRRCVATIGCKYLAQASKFGANAMDRTAFDVSVQQPFPEEPVKGGDQHVGKFAHQVAGWRSITVESVRVGWSKLSPGPFVAHEVARLLKWHPEPRLGTR